MEPLATFARATRKPSGLVSKLDGDIAICVCIAGVPEPTDLNALIAEAGKDFADYQRLTAEGNLGEAGEKLEELKRVIGKLNAHRK